MIARLCAGRVLVAAHQKHTPGSAVTFGSDVSTRQLVKRVAHNDVSLQAAYKTDHKVTATVKARLQQTPTAKVTTGRDCAAAHPDLSQATRSARLVLKRAYLRSLVIRPQFKEGE